MKAKEELSRLQKEGLKRAVSADVVKDFQTPELDEYLRIFAVPVFSAGSVACICCGARLGGIFGGFEWALAHGEGSCSRCGYPGRAYHYDVGPDKRLEYILQYHPDELRVNEPELEAEAQ